MDFDRLEARRHDVPDGWDPAVFRALVDAWRGVIRDVLRELDKSEEPNRVDR
jgi:hypothetical protein